MKIVKSFGNAPITLNCANMSDAFHIYVHVSFECNLSKTNYIIELLSLWPVTKSGTSLTSGRSSDLLKAILLVLSKQALDKGQTFI